MFDQFDLLYAVDVVLGWDLPDASLAFALNAQANFMAGFDPEQIIGFSLH